MSKESEKPTKTLRSLCDASGMSVVTEEKTGNGREGRRSATPQPGSVLAQRFRIVRALGRGGFGEVLLADDLKLNRAVAIKRHHTLPGSPAAHALDEARAIASLKHTHIVDIYDLIDDPCDGLMIVMEYVKGKTLKDRLRRQRLDLPDIVRITSEIADALAHAHRCKVIHRDLKPSNVLLDVDQRVFLTDFGLALVDFANQQSDEICGTPRYMSPEQINSETHRIDGRTDIWSLGIMLYEMLTGVVPFSSGGEESIFSKILSEEPTPLRQLEPRVPVELERICLKCLHKPMTQRYPSITAFREDLDGWWNSYTGAEQQAARELGSGHGGLAEEQSGSEGTSSFGKSLGVVPKGLRPYDEEEAALYLELIPGPRDRKGIPESIRFWKAWAETRGNSHPVGVLYGPSGAGKTSFVRAGLISQLNSSVCPVYVECAPGDLGERIGRAIALHFDCSGSRESLAKLLARVRAHPEELGGYDSLLLVLDQFESWSHQADPLQQRELAMALRHCDGHYLKALVVVRDDYWMGVTELLQRIEVPLQEGRNVGPLELLDRRHARRILEALGRAYGALPPLHQPLSQPQVQFIRDAVEGLARSDHVIAVHLVIFAQVMRAHDWIPATLRKRGGVRGACVAFLYERFESESASPVYRRLAPAVIEVLRLLLPPPHVTVRGHAQTIDQLDTGIQIPRNRELLPEALRVLADDLRLVSQTSTMPAAGPQSDDAARTEQPGYQLAHDFLIGPVREWVETAQRSTWRGRALARLNELSSLWDLQPQRRVYPSLNEFVSILLATQMQTKSPQQLDLLRRAGRFHAGRSLAAVLALIAAIFTGLWALRERSEAAAARRLQLSAKIDLLTNGPVGGVPQLLDEVGNSTLLTPETLQALQQSIQPQTRLRAALLAQRRDPSSFAPLDQILADAEPELSQEFIAAARGADDAVALLRGVLADDAPAEAKNRARIVLAALGEDQPLVDALQFQPDAQPQLDLIATAIAWRGSPELWLRLVRDAASDATRYGAMAVLGSHPLGALSAGFDWQPVIDLVSSPDALLHSTASWLLETQQPALLPAPPQPPPAAEWTVSASGLELVRVEPGQQPVEEGLLFTRPPATVPEVSEPILVTRKPIDAERFAQFLEQWAPDDPDESEDAIRAFRRVYPEDSVDLAAKPALGFRVETVAEFCNWISEQEGLEPAYRRTGTESRTDPESGYTYTVGLYDRVAGASGYRFPSSSEYAYLYFAQIQSGAPKSTIMKMLDAVYPNDNDYHRRRYALPCRAGIQTWQPMIATLTEDGDGIFMQADFTLNQLAIHAISRSSPSVVTGVLLVRKP